MMDSAHVILPIGRVPRMVYRMISRTAAQPGGNLSDRLTSIEDARAMILAEAEPIGAETRPLAGCVGLVLAVDLVASTDVPSFDNSAMDGYAVLAADTAGASSDHPASLLVTDTIAAGHKTAAQLSLGQAARIMTGAPMPQGADAVAQVEITTETGGRVMVEEPVKQGKNVRRAGSDVSAGQVVLRAGTVLGPAEIGMAANLGFSEVLAHARPRVAILSTGSELVEPGRTLAPGQIYNANGYSLRALCQQLGIEPRMLGIAPDEKGITKELIAQGLEQEVLITTGGVSVGAFDFVKEVQDDLGVDRLLWGVAMKPGKPLVFGKRGSTLVFGLPGNPVSAMVSFELFVRPALLRLMGYKSTSRTKHRAVIAEDLKALKERTHVVRVRVWRDEGVWKATSTGDQGSARMSSMVGANGLVFVPAATSGFKAGTEVEVLMISAPHEEADR